MDFLVHTGYIRLVGAPGNQVDVGLIYTVVDSGCQAGELKSPVIPS